MNRTVANPKAAALAYDGNGAPRVTAKGSDATAEQIVSLAQQHWRPIFENPFLVDMLCQMELDQEIPEELFRAVAHIIAFAYELEQTMEDTKQPDC